MERVRRGVLTIILSFAFPFSHRKCRLSSPKCNDFPCRKKCISAIPLWSFLWEWCSSMVRVVVYFVELFFWTTTSEQQPLSTDLTVVPELTHRMKLGDLGCNIRWKVVDKKKTENYHESWHGWYVVTCRLSSIFQNNIKKHPQEISITTNTLAY
jgi:hypothetical protein